MKIKVEQRHINLGYRDDPCQCAIALAVKEALETDFAMVLSTILVRGQEFEIPEAVKAFITAFDNGNPVTPFEFDLPLK
jgi:hypothetical protein